MMSNSGGSSGFLGAMLLGMRLRCPACGQGEMSSGRRLKDACPNCGWRFFRLGDGDWLVTWIVAYTVAALVMLVVWPLLHVFAGLDLLYEVLICAVLGAVAVAVLFQNCQGASAGILYFLRVRWKE